MTDSRKNIFDIIYGKHPIKKEIENIVTLFRGYKSIKYSDYYNNLDFSFEEFASEHFLKWSGRGTYITLDELKNDLGINDQLFNHLSEENTLQYLEYVINIFNFSKKMFHLQYKTKGMEITMKMSNTLNQALTDNILSLLSQLNYCIYQRDEDTFILIPDKPEVNEVVTLIEDKTVQLAILEYNHVKNRNNLAEKFKILSVLAHDFDGDKKNKLKENDAWKQLANDLGFMFNKLNIRHNNTEQAILEMSNEDKLLWYDRTYLLYLTAILALEYRSDFKPDIEYLKTQVKR